MTESLYSKLKRLDAEATKGPWKWSGRKVDEDGFIYHPQGSNLNDTLIVLDDTYEDDDKDLDLITETRNALPQILELIEAADETIKWWRSSRGTIVDPKGMVWSRVLRIQNESLTPFLKEADDAETKS